MRKEKQIKLQRHLAIFNLIPDIYIYIYIFRYIYIDIYLFQTFNYIDKEFQNHKTCIIKTINQN